MGRTWTKSERFLIAMLLVLPLLMAAVGDLELMGDLIFTKTGGGVIYDAAAIRLYDPNDSSGGGSYAHRWIYASEWDPGEYGDTIKIPCLAYGAGTFLTTDAEGNLLFIATAGYEGDIQSVWEDTSGDVGAMTAAAGDSLDAGSADSTVPWKVNATAAPTTEGAGIWDSDDDILAIGDGSATLYVGMKNASVPTAAWEVDGNDDLMPITGSFDDRYYDLDSNDDLMPAVLVHFVPDTSGDLMPTS